MADEHGEQQIYWYRPEQRGIIPLDGFHIPGNLKRLYGKMPFELRIDSDFEGVIRACSERDETWISEEIIQSYLALHRKGHAHSFECWKDGQLVGGLYGVELGRAFFGESMFHRIRDASKIALVFLVEQLQKAGFILLDTQYINDHLLQFGATEISHDDYMERLETALN